MTKRFNIVGGYVYDGEECISHFEDTEHRIEIVDKLNELAEEKEIAIDGIKIADELIRKYGSEELKHEWKKEVTVKYG